MDGDNVVVYFRGINLIYADDGSRTYYHFNAHGDVVVLTNTSGNKTKSYSYNAFGVEYNEATLDDNPFRYCGEYYDKETKTIYLRARYYNAEQGRFTQEDPIRDGYNWYAYCGNNPIMFVDPYGLALKSTTAICYDGARGVVSPNNEEEQIENNVQDEKHDFSVKDCAKIVVEEIDTLVDRTREMFKDAVGTYSRGLYGSASFLCVDVNVQLGVSIDTQGNIALQGSVSGGATSSSSPSVAGGLYSTVTNAPTVNELEGDGYAWGGSGTIPVKGPLALNAGKDINIIPDAKKNTFYIGETTLYGVAFAREPSIENHFNKGSTIPIIEINLYAIWDMIYAEVMSW